MHISRSLQVSPECSSGLLYFLSLFTIHMVSMAIITKEAAATPSSDGSQVISVDQIFSANKSDNPLVKLVLNVLLDQSLIPIRPSLVLSQMSSHHSPGVINGLWTQSSLRMVSKTVLAPSAHLPDRLSKKKWRENASISKSAHSVSRTLSMEKDQR